MGEEAQPVYGDGRGGLIWDVGVGLGKQRLLHHKGVRSGVNVEVAAHSLREGSPFLPQEGLYLPGGLYLIPDRQGVREHQVQR